MFNGLNQLFLKISISEKFICVWNNNAKKKQLMCISESRMCNQARFLIQLSSPVQGGKEKHYLVLCTVSKTITSKYAFCVHLFACVYEYACA